MTTNRRIEITHRRRNKRISREEEKVYNANETSLARHPSPDLADQYFEKVGNTLEEEHPTQ